MQPARTVLFHDYLDYSARVHPDSVFAIFGDEVMSYAEAARQANRLANFLVSRGLRRGDRFAYLSKNSIEMVIAYFAGSKSGIIPVPLNYRLAPAEWAYIIADSGARLVFAETRYAEQLDAHRADLPRVADYIALGEAHEAWTDYAAAMAAQPTLPPSGHGSQDDVIYQMYTSGTTGRPKGAMISHRALLTNLAQSRYCLDTPGRRGMRILICTPLYHASGAATVGATVFCGATLVIHRDFIPADVARSLREDRIAGVNLVPSMIQALLTDVPDIAQHTYDALVGITYGASPIAEDTLRRALSVFDCEFYQAFGLTETTASLTMLNNEDHLRALDERPDLLLSCGRPVFGTDIRIVDDSGAELPPGEVGEIVVRGPQLMDGYWNQPDETERAVRGGWFHTGDAGAMDADGYVYIRDRMKDVIISGAENVYPREVENVLFGHPDIVDAAVIGVPHDRYGEAVMAFVVCRADARPAIDELIAYCREHLGGFKIPRQFQFLEALPRNPSGKVLKAELRAPFWADRARRIG